MQYTVWQDGDCWLVPVDMVWDDKTETFIYPYECEEPEAEYDFDPAPKYDGF